MKVKILVGVSVDGKISPGKNKSSKAFGHLLKPSMYVPIRKMRSWADAVMVGSQTIMNDDPSIKIGEKKRIVIDRNARLPTNKKIFDGSSPTYVFTCKKTNRYSHLSNVYTIWIDPKIFWVEFKKQLKKIQINKLLVEGGGNLNYLLISNSLAHELNVGIFPFLIGGNETPTLFEGPQLNSVISAKKVTLLKHSASREGFVFLTYKVNNSR